MKLLIYSFLILSAMPALAIEPRAKCLDKFDNHDSSKNLDDFKGILNANRITNISGNELKVQDLENFLFEYKKFPESLKQEMLENKASISILVGNGVSDDPSWDPKDEKTIDKRDWSVVPGSGGFPYVANNERASFKAESDFISNRKAYCLHPQVKNNKDLQCKEDFAALQPTTIVKPYPTRIVVDKIYNVSMKDKTGHGSVNLFLHEHAHSLDSLYESRGITKSEAWQDLFKSDDVQEYMKVVCLSKDYCMLNDNEAFAEMFAYYYSCEEAKEHMERNAPDLATYFHDLKRVRPKIEVHDQKPKTEAEKDNKSIWSIFPKGVSRN